MAIHRLTTLTLAVPNVAAAAEFYRQFGLTEAAPGRFDTTDGGHQLELIAAPKRGLARLGLGVESPDDLDRLGRSLAPLGAQTQRDGDRLHTSDPASGLALTITVAPKLPVPARKPAVPVNGPGRDERVNQPADGVLRTGPVRPRKLSHIAVASPDHDASVRFFMEGLGFAASDRLPFISFLRCSTDHHNIAIQQGPGTFLHHTAWEVTDVDEVGRGGGAMVAADPARQLWGLGRHAIGSNFFWYLRDPAGHFAEYVSDLDVITDAAAYTPPAWEGEQSIKAWSPPLPPEFLMPSDLPEILG